MAFRAELAEARQQQQRRYERDLKQFRARQREREQERRERWLARHTLIDGQDGGVRCGGCGTCEACQGPGYRLDGHVVGSPGVPRNAARSCSASTCSTTSRSSAARSSRTSSRTSRCSRTTRLPPAWMPRGCGPQSPALVQALVPWVLDQETEQVAASAGQHENVDGSQSQPPDGDHVSPQTKRQPARQPAPPDIGAVRLALKIKQENMEYERRQRQRLSRSKENSASLRRRIPKNDPGHRLGRPGDSRTPPTNIADSAGTATTANRRAPRAAPHYRHPAAMAQAQAEPTITLPDDADDAERHGAYRGSPYHLTSMSRETSRNSSTQWSSPSGPLLRFPALPRAARSPTVARNTPAASAEASTTSTPRPRVVAAKSGQRTFRTYRAFPVPRTVTPSHNCGVEHRMEHRVEHPQRNRPAPSHAGPHINRRIAHTRDGNAAAGKSRPKAKRISPPSPGIKIGSGVILPQVHAATILAMPRSAAAGLPGFSTTLSPSESSKTTSIEPVGRSGVAAPVPGPARQPVDTAVFNPATPVGSTPARSANPTTSSPNPRSQRRAQSSTTKNTGSARTSPRASSRVTNKEAVTSKASTSTPRSTRVARPFSTGSRLTASTLASAAKHRASSSRPPSSSPQIKEHKATGRPWR